MVETPRRTMKARSHRRNPCEARGTQCRPRQVVGAASNGYHPGWGSTARSRDSPRTAPAHRDLFCLVG
eukprot:scaffold16863_cov70-Phaeocystis_antarctica.AAC.1